MLLYFKNPICPTNESYAFLSVKQQKYFSLLKGWQICANSVPPNKCHCISSFLGLGRERDVKHPFPLRTFVGVRASPQTLSMWPCKNISHIQVLVTNVFPTPQIKLKRGLQVGGWSLLATHLDQSNYVTNQRQGVLNKSNLNLFIRPLQGSSRLSKLCIFSRSQQPSRRFTGFHSINPVNLIQ
jgi:hypothetical protein